MPSKTDTPKSPNAPKAAQAAPTKGELASYLKERRRLEQSLSDSRKDGAATAAMEGVGTNFISAFAVALKATRLEVSILLTAPQFLGSLAQLLSARMLEQNVPRKKLITRAILVQAATWLPILLVPFLFTAHAPLLLIVFYTIFFVSGSLATPAWQSLMGDLVAPKTRGSFFASRSAASGAIALIATLAAGHFLNAFETSVAFGGFALLFLAAFCFRMVSLRYLHKMWDPPYVPKIDPGFSFSRFLAHLRDNNLGKFTLYLSVLYFFMYVALPLYDVYLLRTLGLDYLTYALLFSAYMGAMFLSLHYWGRVTDRFGNKAVLAVSATLYALVPLGWTANHFFTADAVAGLAGLQILRGVAWGGLFLTIANFIYDNTTTPGRARAFAYYNVLSGAALLCGGLFGGVLTTMVPDHPAYGSSMILAFVLSFVGLALCALALSRELREVREVTPITERELYFRVATGTPLFEGVKAEVASARTYARRVRPMARMRAIEQYMEREIERVDELVEQAVHALFERKGKGKNK